MFLINNYKYKHIVYFRIKNYNTKILNVICINFIMAIKKNEYITI